MSLAAVRKALALRRTAERIREERAARLASRQGAGASAEDLARWRHNPVAFAKEALGIEAWEVQAAIMMAVTEHHRVAVRSGHKIGKSLLLAILALWWAVTWPDGKVLVTAPTATQVKDIVWAELRKLVARANRIGKIAVPTPAKDPATGIRWDDGRVILGRSTDKPENIQGYSGPANLYLIDEASGVDKEIYEALVGNTAGGSDDDDTAVAKFVMTGNPTQTSGIFFEAFHQARAHWKCFRVGSDQTPNAIAGKVLVPGLATRDYVDRLKDEYGEDSDLYRVRVRGDFPRQGGSSVIALDVVVAAAERWGVTEPTGRLHIGVDPARFGDDDTVSVARRGNKVLEPLPDKDVSGIEVHHGLDEEAVAGMVLNQARAYHIKGEPKPVVKVDGHGVGAGVISVLRQSDEIQVIAVFSAEKANDEDGYPNRRSELWFALGDWLKAGGAIPPDDDPEAAKLQQQLVSPNYKFTARGQREVEKKRDFKKRLGRSPDHADALALAVYTPANDVGIANPEQADAGAGMRWGSSGGRGFG